MLSKNISRSGRIDYAGDVDVYSLSFNTVPGVDNNKVYQVYTTGSLDTYGVLSVYDSSSDWDYEIGYYDVATDDNSGASNNFEIVEHIPDTYLMDGTVIYYIKVSAYGNAVGNYTVHFEEAPDDAGDSFSSASIALTTAGEYDDAWDVPQFWLNNINDVDYFRFAAPKDGVYWAVFDLLGNIYDYELKIYDESHNLIKEIDDEYDDWYRGDKVTLEAGKDYYIKVASGYDVEQYAIQIFYESDGDDWKDTFEGDLVDFEAGSGGGIGGTFTGENDVDCMKMLVYETGSYRIFDRLNSDKVNGLDTACILYDSDKVTELGRSYSGIDENNPGVKTAGLELCLTLEGNSSGKEYYLKVFSESGDTDGEYEVKAQKVSEPDDARFSEDESTGYSGQWGLLNTYSAIKTPNTGKNTLDSKIGVDINVLPVWEYSTGEGVKIGVLDSGIDTNHEDLTNNILSGGWNFVHGNNNVFPTNENIYTYPDPDDPSKLITPNLTAEQGHGTHVSGIIAADTNNAMAMAGVAPDAEILPIKVLGTSLKPDVPANWSSNDVLIEGIDYAKDENCDIINMSIGGYGEYQEVRTAMNRASDILFVVSAGNDSEDIGLNPDYPASYDLANKIVVAACNPDGSLADFTNYGGATDIAAPGVQIYSALPYDDYDYWDGTSMAAPMVSGTAALIWAFEPSLTALEVKERIVNAANVTYRSDYEVDDGYGMISRVKSKGILNAWRAFSDSARLQQSKMSEQTIISYDEPNEELVKSNILAFQTDASNETKTNQIFVNLKKEVVQIETILQEALANVDYQILKQMPLTDSYLIQFDTIARAEQAVEVLNSRNDINYAEINYLIELD